MPKRAARDLFSFSSARRYCRQARFWLCSFHSFRVMAWNSAAKQMVSSTRIGTSQMRYSSVGKNGCGRTSHQIFFPLSMQPVLIRS